MITLKRLPFGKVRVTFSLEKDQPPGTTSVVGCFNDWRPGSHVLRRRSNGRKSASVTLPEGSVVSFRYLSEGGRWTDDPAVPDRDHDGNNRLSV
ncbi:MULTISPECIES: isoamylase early set domain-containing protein [Amycolatopsis]|uniref:Glycogen recognition site of AMP-activated protein kinase n=2 Tax=Amycolatopsis TaxID=1813 RepID=A0A1I3QYV6_9PSEU|nr:isoamylase early set domain-containing protein [Amycolatopsis sacchari]SFJ38639.1 hypothetical protein SAMN05421835_10537 [Amycolatopsis sacchari]